MFRHQDDTRTSARSTTLALSTRWRQADVDALIVHIAARCEAWLARRGVGAEAVRRDDDALPSLQSAYVAGRSGPGWSLDRGGEVVPRSWRDRRQVVHIGWRATAARRRVRKPRAGRRKATTLRGPLPRPEVRADDPTITAHAGLLPLGRFMMEQLDLTSRLGAIVGTGGRRRVYPVHLALLASMFGSLAGMERMAHFDAFQGDCLVIRALRFSQWPVRKVAAVALASLSDAQRDQVVDLVTEVGLSTLPPSTKSVIIHFDPTVIVSYADAEGAAFGYCGKERRQSDTCRSSRPSPRGARSCWRSIAMARG